jgi:hypothetical protein
MFVLVWSELFFPISEVSKHKDQPDIVISSLSFGVLPFQPLKLNGPWSQAIHGNARLGHGGHTALVIDIGKLMNFCHSLRVSNT